MALFLDFYRPLLLSKGGLIRRAILSYKALLPPSASQQQSLQQQTRIQSLPTLRLTLSDLSKFKCRG